MQEGFPCYSMSVGKSLKCQRLEGGLTSDSDRFLGGWCGRREQEAQVREDRGLDEGVRQWE